MRMRAAIFDPFPFLPPELGIDLAEFNSLAPEAGIALECCAFAD